MIKETTVTGKTVEEAVAAGAAELGYDVGNVEYEVLKEARKGILGIGSSDATVRVYHSETKAEQAKAFIETMLADMGVDASVVLSSEDGEGAKIDVTGEGLGLLIGKHGDVLDAIQSLATIVANKGNDEFYRISVDVEGYREKRAEALRALARRVADRVLRTRRSFTLEPMNAYERRIIHSEVQTIEGVTTYSIGQDAARKIVIAIDRS